MRSKKYLPDYFKKFNQLTKIDNLQLRYLKNISEELVRCKKRKKKVAIFGNGGSAAISSHFSVDLTKVGKIRCVNFNEADLITCFSNDYGYEFWIKKAIELYLDKGDVLILISSSGSSKNLVNAAKYAKNNGINVITFTGFSSENPLKMNGDVNFWLECKSYNIIEGIHQLWLLSICDLIIGKTEYSVS